MEACLFEARKASWNSAFETKTDPTVNGPEPMDALERYIKVYLETVLVFPDG